jgi:hypothetical protein
MKDEAGTGYATRIGELRNAYKVLLGQLEGGNYLGEVSADGRITVKYIVKKWGVSMWDGFLRLIMGSYKQYEPVASIKVF